MDDQQPAVPYGLVVASLGDRLGDRMVAVESLGQHRGDLPGRCRTTAIAGASFGTAASIRLIAWTPQVLRPMAMIRREPPGPQLQRREHGVGIPPGL
jgi:hypothetical protein